MAKELACPVCGAKIHGHSTEEVMKNAMEHGKKLKHPEMTDEQMKMLKTGIQDV